MYVYRFGHGYTLQAKVKSEAGGNEPQTTGVAPPPPTTGVLPPPYVAQPGVPLQNMGLVYHLKEFIQQSVYGSVLLEEHQVLYIFSLAFYMN